MRDVLIIGIACAAAILLGAWLYFAAPGAPAKAPGAVAFTTLDQGSYSGSVTERKNYRIKSQDELDELWKLVHGTGGPANVDFSADEVIAVFDGTHATGGYAINIASVTDVPGGSRDVAIMHTTPGEGCAASDAVSSPFQIILLPKSPYPLEHEDETSAGACR